MSKPPHKWTDWSEPPPNESIPPWKWPESSGIYAIRCLDTRLFGYDQSQLPIQSEPSGPPDVPSVYYVGHGYNIAKRLRTHFDGGSSEWTKRHPPAEVVGMWYGDQFVDDRGRRERLENDITLRYIKQYGFKNVRGGRWVHTDRDQCPPLPWSSCDTQTDSSENTSSTLDKIATEVFTDA